ncbi:hypothetical protein Tco_0687643 [Tanacetum coccineum]
MWKWPEEWNSDFVELGPLQVPILRDGIEDTAVWMSRNGHEKKFKISNVWMDMNSNGTKVDWHLLVWFAQSIPRHAFITCDSHNHLFFTCEFSKEVWNELLKLLKLLNARLSESWDQILIEMKALYLNKNIWSILKNQVLSKKWRKDGRSDYKEDKEYVLPLHQQTMSAEEELHLKSSSA